MSDTRWIATLAGLALAGAAQAQQRDLRVCADPNNLPFSNTAGQGFENRIVQLIAKDLGARVTYTWWAQRRGYVRNTLEADQCDLVPGVASGVDMLATTKPYYRSTYVFVTRADRRLALSSLDDPRLKRLKIGVQMVGNDQANTPPAHALAERGMIRNVRGYMLYGDYSRPNPPSAILDAVVRGDVDVALVWGPLAGYFAKRASVPLVLAPVSPRIDHGLWPMTFAISMGVRRKDAAFKAEIEAALERNREAIQAILRDYGTPDVGP